MAQALVDADNPWKDKRPVFDSSFCPEIWCHVINDWIDKVTEVFIKVSTLGPK